jgi:CxxC motif-containing protein (DUF1111 family)
MTRRNLPYTIAIAATIASIGAGEARSAGRTDSSRDLTNATSLYHGNARRIHSSSHETTLAGVQSDDLAAGAETWPSGITSPFRRGLALFQKSFAPSNGLRPEFNATSCASCHNRPSTGGSGSDSDVVEWVYQGVQDSLGTPGVHFRLDVKGNAIALMSTTTVRRRPPALFGIGLLEAIPDKELRSRSDPFDDDHDGISGRLPTRFGCVGRLGWQSTTCDIESFVVWALSNELGILSAPKRRSEISDEDLSALVAYVRQLPAPAAAASSEGIEIFERVLCAKCHGPLTGMARQDGIAVPVRAYTDLLLHEMGSDKRDGERDSRTEFRTPPLWGIAATGPPYLHDGSAKTLEDAIVRHDGEGARSRQLYSALPADQKQALLRFVATR